MPVFRKNRRLHVVLPNSLLLEIDAREGKRRRSGFIRDAIAEKLEHLQRMTASDLAGGLPGEAGIPDREGYESAAE